MFCSAFHQNERDWDNCSGDAIEDDSGTFHGHNDSENSARTKQVNEIKSDGSVTEKNDPLTFYRNVYRTSFCLQRANAHVVLFIYWNFKGFQQRFVTITLKWFHAQPTHSHTHNDGNSKCTKIAAHSRSLFRWWCAFTVSNLRI